MAQGAKASFDDDDQECGPVNIATGQTGNLHVVIDGTITVTLKRSVAGLAYVDVETGYTSSVTRVIDGPGDYKLVSSGTSGGSAEVALSVNQ